MCQQKIIFTGPEGAGKTTAIQSISDTPPIKTDVVSSHKCKTKKRQTTVAMDYGVININPGSKLHLYGTPGQKRFDFMWDILSSSGGIGLILLVDNTKADPFQDMHFFLKAFKHYIAKTKVVIGVTQMDLVNKPKIEDYQNQFINFAITPTVFSIDARNKSDVSKLIQEFSIKTLS